MQRDRVKEKEYEYCICDTVMLIQGLEDEFDELIRGDSLEIEL